VQPHLQNCQMDFPNRIADVPGLVSMLLEPLTALDLVCVVQVCVAGRNVTLGSAGVAATHLNRRLKTSQTLIRWRKSTDLPILEELYRTELAESYFRRIAGCYHLRDSEEVILEIYPSGQFLNSSRQHHFAGQAWIAFVIPAPPELQVDLHHLYLLDRQYTQCTLHGVPLTAQQLSFVDKEFRCFSVSGFKLGNSHFDAGLLMENVPYSSEEMGWNITSAGGAYGHSDAEEGANGLRPIGLLRWPLPLSIGLDELLMEPPDKLWRNATRTAVPAPLEVSCPLHDEAKESQQNPQQGCPVQ